MSSHQARGSWHLTVKGLALFSDTESRMCPSMTKFLKNVVRGAGSVLSISPPTHRRSDKIIHKSDAEALNGDWCRVGDDIRNAYRQTINARRR